MKSNDNDDDGDYFRYGAHPQLSGVTLEWPAWVIMGDTEPVQNISSRVRSVIIRFIMKTTQIISPSSPVLLYALGSSKAFSPHPCHWARMLELYGERLGDCPPGFQCVKQVILASDWSRQITLLEYWPLIGYFRCGRAGGQYTQGK